MCRNYLLFLSAVLLFASCVTHPEFTRNDIRICQTEDYTGYFVPDGVGSEGMLYVDAGNLNAREYRVEITQWLGKTRVEGEGLERSKCTLTHYRNPAYRDVADGLDYLKPQYAVDTAQNVVYGKAMGLWTSYPYDYSVEYATLVKDKVEELWENELAELKLRMDIYAPSDEGNHLRPLLVMIHEGAFFAGDKADDASRLWCEKFAACGYVAVSVNYRLGFNLITITVPEAAYCAMQDVNAAIRYMLAHQVNYKIDPDNIFLAGCSAGAILALNTAYMNDLNLPESMREVAQELGPLSAVPVSPSYDKPFGIRAVGNMWGAILSPEEMKSSTASIISFHSKYDPIVPFGRGYPFESLARELLRKVPAGERIGRFLVQQVMPLVYGSSCVDSLAQAAGIRTEMNPSELNKHTLVRNDSTGLLNKLHEEFFEKMNHFFVQEMIGPEVSVQQDRRDAQILCLEHPENIRECSWTLQDGFITELLDPTRIRVILYGMAPEHIVTVKGVYTSGIAFEKSFSIEMM